MSKLLPLVLKVAIPCAGATQLIHTEEPPTLPSWLGSPASWVAPTLLARPTRLGFPTTALAAKSSDRGRLGTVTRKIAGRLSTAPATLATVTR